MSTEKKIRTNTNVCPKCQAENDYAKCEKCGWRNVSFSRRQGAPTPGIYKRVRARKVAKHQRRAAKRACDRIILAVIHAAKHGGG